MRISYSIANTFFNGQYEKAVSMLRKEEIQHPIALERAFAFGSGFHFACEHESKRTHKLPAIFQTTDTLKQLAVVGTEIKLVKQLPNGDTLSGVLDGVAINTAQQLVIIYDIKTGNSFDPMQAYVYQYLVKDSDWWNTHIGNIQPELAFFLHINKQTGYTNTNIAKLSYPTTQAEWDAPERTTFTTGVNWICTIAEDIKAAYPEFA